MQNHSPTSFDFSLSSSVSAFGIWHLILVATLPVHTRFTATTSPPYLYNMAVPKSLLVLVLGAFTASVDSFTVRCPSTPSFSASIRPTTCLFAEEDATDETVESGEAAPAAASDTDILNSPAFLKRKIEVLKSDIEATEKETEAAQAQVEVGKAEWGPQLDALRQEVSCSKFAGPAARLNLCVDR